MEKHLEQYLDIINTMGMSNDIPIDQFQDLILSNIMNVNPGLETVTVRQEGESHTAKLGNLRFRMREVMESIVKTIANVWNANPAVVVWNVIQFIKEVKKLSTVPISKNDARVLVAIWLIKLEKPSNLWPNNDELCEYLIKELTEENIEASLNNLHKLQCIDRTDQYIRIEEEIEF